ncbi:MAG TPA: YceH family protein [Solirubrobacteraceae bacterium]|nr:YceH family protein [Solirubrobacteraceae bacterium]
MNLSASEVRVLGCMLEKQITTPDIYPLTLNGLRLACNQSTNRDPVVDYDDAALRDALHRLERRGYARLASGRGSRAPKYRHLLAEALPLRGDEHAVLCVLLLRGGQTPGELKQRTERMHGFADLDAVHDTLQRLIARGLVARLDRRPGQKEERYGHLLSADSDDAGAASGATVPSAPAADLERLAAPVLAAPLTGLEERVARLEREVAELRAALGDAGEPEPEPDRTVTFQT